jgi:GMP synthase (glutamine-hydrolysing)
MLLILLIIISSGFYRLNLLILLTHSFLSEMKIHVIHHVAYEGLGFISNWIKENSLTLSQTFTFNKPEFPSSDNYDGLIVMGGPMSVNDESQFSWLQDEKALIRDAIAKEKKILGICLGSQLIAECLGGKVYRNIAPEVGWFPVKKTFLFHSWFAAFDEREEETVFHWHYETFDIPEGAVKLFRSDGCHNQAFQYDNHVLALQFHLEVARENLLDMIKNSADDLRPSQFVQHTEKMIKCASQHEEKNREILFDLLSCFFLEED